MENIVESIESNNNHFWVNDHSLQKSIGAGAFGFVFSAINKLNLSTSAIKLTFPKYSSKTDEKEKEKKAILREYKIMVGKKHPNIVSVFTLSENQFSASDLESLLANLGMDDEVYDPIGTYIRRATREQYVDAVCIQMEICGANLRQWLNSVTNNNTPTSEILDLQVDIVQGLIDGVKFLHNNNIMHRDLKPENVMFSIDEKNNEYSLPIKIGDFGLCRQFHTGDTNTASLTAGAGTYEYKAPEVDTKEYGLQGDLYSLGLVMWEVLQLIENKERRRLFDNFVNDRNESLVNKHQRVTNCRQVIVGLTKRNVVQRVQRIEDVTLQVVRNSDDYFHSYPTPTVVESNEMLQDLVDIIVLLGPPLVTETVDIVENFKELTLQLSDLLLQESTEIIEHFNDLFVSLTDPIVNETETVQENPNEFRFVFPSASTVTEAPPDIDNSPNSPSDVSRIIKVARTSEELRKYLLEALAYDIIELIEGVYEGEFTLKQNHVTLRSVVHCSVTFKCSFTEGERYVLTILGNKCQLLNLDILGTNKSSNCLKVQGSGNILHNVEFKNWNTAVSVIGWNNNMSNITVTDVTYGISIKGSDNKIFQSYMLNVSWRGFLIQGGRNCVSSATLVNVRRGISVSGDNNVVNTVDYEHTKTNITPVQKLIGVWICEGKKNYVGNLTTTNANLKVSNYDWGLIINPGTTNTRICNSVCGPVQVAGAGHTLINVDAEEFLYIRGCGHIRQNCKYQHCENYVKNTASDRLTDEMCPPSPSYWYV